MAYGEEIGRKVITINSFPNNASKTFKHGINAGNLIKIWGICKSGDVYLPMPYPAIEATGGIELYADATNVTIVTGTDRSKDSGFVVLQFTEG